MTRRILVTLVAAIIQLAIVVSGVAGFLFVFGSVGALEHDMIGFTQFFVQVAIGFALMLVCGALHMIFFED